MSQFIPKSFKISKYLANHFPGEARSKEQNITGTATQIKGPASGGLEQRDLQHQHLFVFVDPQDKFQEYW